jgi:hypothetical protein
MLSLRRAAPLLLLATLAAACSLETGGAGEDLSTPEGAGGSVGFGGAAGAAGAAGVAGAAGGAESCGAGRGDCDGQPANGCETDLETSVSHCGACGKACAAGPHAKASCVGGACSVACEGSFSDCNGSAADGCEVDLMASATSCGACGTACADGPHALASCVAGACQLACEKGFADCDSAGSNGCESELGTSTAHCGGCGKACPTGPHATASCFGGGCVLACDPDRADCDGASANGCEVDLLADANHCGACATACKAGAHALAACAAGACANECEAGFADCDGDQANGCEVDLMTSVTSCGACGAACSAAGGTPSCVGGACQVGCGAGQADCNGDPSDGCEISLTSLASCGACGTPCAGANATPSCPTGQCKLACDDGFGNCDNLQANGCEADLLGSIAHCGSCTKTCSAANGTPSCTDGACSIACSAGFADCNDSAIDGCEIDLATSPDHCGACGKGCLGGECKAGLCQPLAIASDELAPIELSIDDDSVYWLNYGHVEGQGNTAHWAEGQLRVAPKAGGQATTLADKQPFPGRITVAQGVAFFTTFGTYPGYADGAIFSAPAAGGTPKQLWYAQPAPLGIAVDGTSVYWVNRGNHIVARVNTDGTNVAVLSGGQLLPSTIRAANDKLYWSVLKNLTGSNYENASILVANKDGSSPTVLAAGQPNVDRFVVDAQRLYFITPGHDPARDDGVVRAIDLATLVVTTLADKQAYPWDIAQDDTYLYWTNLGSPTNGYAGAGIHRTPKLGGPVVALTTTPGERGIAVDASAIYFANRLTNTINKLAK